MQLDGSELALAAGDGLIAWADARRTYLLDTGAHDAHPRSIAEVGASGWLAVSARGIAWANTASGEIAIVHPGNPTVVHLAASELSPRRLIISGGEALWVASAGPHGSSIRAISLVGGSARTLADSLAPQDEEFTSDETFVYFSKGGNIVRRRRDGTGADETLTSTPESGLRAPLQYDGRLFFGEFGCRSDRPLCESDDFTRFWSLTLSPVGSPTLVQEHPGGGIIFSGADYWAEARMKVIDVHWLDGHGDVVTTAANRAVGRVVATRRVLAWRDTEGNVFMEAF